MPTCSHPNPSKSRPLRFRRGLTPPTALPCRRGQSLSPGLPHCQGTLHPSLPLPYVTFAKQTVRASGATQWIVSLPCWSHWAVVVTPARNSKSIARPTAPASHPPSRIQNPAGLAHFSDPAWMTLRPPFSLMETHAPPSSGKSLPPLGLRES